MPFAISISTQLVDLSPAIAATARLSAKQVATTASLQGAASGLIAITFALFMPQNYRCPES
jgi:hypothetical protein